MEHRKLSADLTPVRMPSSSLRSHAARGEPGRETAPRTLQFIALDLRQQVQIGSLLKITGPFVSSHWVVGGQRPPDALVIGLGTQEGLRAWQANRLEPRALPVLMLGTVEQARSTDCDPAEMLLLSPPFRYLSLFYCLDALARQCARWRAGRPIWDGPAMHLRALVVDDSPTVRAQLSNVIMRIGMQCDQAEGAAAALARLENRHYDLIVVDVLMPDMDGYKLTREIKRGRRHRNTPVIILTSQSSPFDRARGALAGCDIYLTKPVGLKAFYEAATKALRKSMAVDDLSLWLTEPVPRLALGDASSASLHSAGHAASFPPVVKLHSR